MKRSNRVERTSASPFFDQVMGTESQKRLAKLIGGFGIGLPIRLVEQIPVERCVAGQNRLRFFRAQTLEPARKAL